MTIKKQEPLSDIALTMRLLGIIATNQFTSMSEKVQFLNKHGLQSNEISRSLGISSGDASSYLIRNKKIKNNKSESKNGEK